MLVDYVKVEQELVDIINQMKSDKVDFSASDVIEELTLRLDPYKQNHKSDTPQDEHILDTDLDDLEFTFEPELPQTNVNTQASVTIHAHKSQVNVYTSASKPLNKTLKIQENLDKLSKSGLSYERLSNYHVRISTKAGAIDFYLTTESYMYAGECTMGKGFDNMMQHISNLK